MDIEMMHKNQTLTLDTILNLKMTTFSFWKTTKITKYLCQIDARKFAENDRIPPNMNIFRIKAMYRSQKSRMLSFR